MKDIEDRIVELEQLRKDMVPICGAPYAAVPRCLWDEAWLSYAKEYRPSRGQYARLLNEGFYASELDDLRPGWRPVDQELARLRAEIIRLSSVGVLW